jgi:PTH1 family peptidyl-tRNA hydrolase
MILLVGLGNPGNTYAGTRHNIGFIAVDEISHRYNFSSPRVKFTAELAEGTIESTRVISMKPLTYMNNSGISVHEASRFYKIPVQDIIVCHDDLDIPLGRIKVKRGGGHGGHNGLKSLDAHIGKDYLRLRIGIGHPGDRDMVSDYVLSRFAKQEEPEKDRVVSDIATLLPLLLAGDEASFMNKFALMLK